MFLSVMGVGLVTALAMTNETTRDFNLALFLSVIFLWPRTQPSSASVLADPARLAEGPHAQSVRQGRPGAH